MFTKRDDQKIGNYLNSLITKKYPSVRQFCIAYLKKSGTEEPTDTDIIRMQNRMSQIIKGNKAIQTYDLPVFCELLDVSCEQILSCGEHTVLNSGHKTNREIAFSKDEEVWKEYLEREDKLFLNPDEYNKTIIDYALEYKNGDFLKFLMDEKHIWFVDEGVRGNLPHAFGFGAGTDIKRRKPEWQDCLSYSLNEQQNDLRQKMIALAVEMHDVAMLDKLRAREIPTSYELCAFNYINAETNRQSYYDKTVIDRLAHSDGEVLAYFSEEYSITDQFGYEHWFIYPYMPELLERLMANKSKYAESLLRKSLEHNERVYEKLSKMVYERKKCNPRFEDLFRFDDGFLSYMFTKEKHTHPRFCANVIRINAKSGDAKITALTRQLNQLYEFVQTIRPNFRKEEEEN